MSSPGGDPISFGFLFSKKAFEEVQKACEETLHAGKELLSSSGTVLANSFGHISTFYQVAKVSNYTIRGAVYLGASIPEGVRTLLPVTLDLIDGTRIFVFIQYLKGHTDKNGVQHGFLVDWKNNRVDAMASVALNLADGMTTLSLLNDFKILDTAKVAQALGTFQINGVAIFGFVKEMTIGVTARFLVIGGLVLVSWECGKQLWVGEDVRKNTLRLIENGAECMVQGIYLLGFATTPAGVPAIIFFGLVSANLGYKRKYLALNL